MHFKGSVMTVKSLFNSSRYPTLQQIVSEGDSENASLVDDAYDRILLRIVNGELPGGTQLKGTALAKELDVSRTPIIQALARLVVDGIVVQHRHRRAVVRDGAEDWLVDVHQLRQLLEPQAAGLAAGKVEEGVLADLEMLAREALPVKQHEWTLAAAHFDYSLHLVIAEYCGNLPMRSAIRRCWNCKRVSYQEGNDTDRGLRKGYREHLLILECLKNGDADGAQSAMRQHLESAVKSRSRKRIV
jgi:DNA-binding GntR family transcriptional regulator